MNTEEFKCRILSQFKEKDSPIHTIMTYPSRDYRSYVAKRTFLIKEFGIEMIVFNLDDKAPIFEIRFIEPATRLFDYRTVIAPDSFVDEVHYRARMHVEDKMIVFDLHDFCLTQEDYLFKFKDVCTAPTDDNIVRRWCYDLTSGKFLDGYLFKDEHSHGVIRYAAELDRLMATSESNYVEQMIDQNLKDKLEQAMDDARVPLPKRRRIMEIFDTAYKKVTKLSTHSQIIQSIREIRW
jgi:hypothetical protein